MAQSETSIKSKVANGVVVLGENVLIAPDETADYHGRLQIPENCKGQYPTTGTIVKLGLGLFEEKQNGDGKTETAYFTPLAVGDRVVFSKYAGIECKFEDKIMVCLKAVDVLLIVDADLKK